MQPNPATLHAQSFEERRRPRLVLLAQPLFSRASLQPLHDWPLGRHALPQGRPTATELVRAGSLHQRRGEDERANSQALPARVVCVSYSHGAMSSQAPRMTVTQRSGRVISQIAMIAMLATMGPMIESLARADPRIEHGR